MLYLLTAVEIFSSEFYKENANENCKCAMVSPIYVIELTWGPYWENIGQVPFLQVLKLAKKEKSTNIFPGRTEQASSINFSIIMALVWISWRHSTFDRWNARATIRRQKFVFITPFLQNFCQNFWSDNKALVVWQGNRFLLTLKCLLFISFQGHKSVKSLREWSILAVRIAKFGPLREPIRMLLFTLDQFGHIITINYTVLGCSSMPST